MQSKFTLGQSVSTIAGIGPLYYSKLTRAGLQTVQDLLYNFPFRYEDLSQTLQIADLKEGQTVTIVATVWQVTKIRTRTGKTLIKAVLMDHSGRIEAVWFNQQYLITVLKPNLVLNFSGKVSLFGSKLSLLNPKFETFSLDKEQVHTGRLVPVYSEAAGLSTRWLRSKIHTLLSLTTIPEVLPIKILQDEKLILREQALRQVHFPTSLHELSRAQEYLAYEELLAWQLRNQLGQQKNAPETKPLEVTKQTQLQFEKLLPFKLTESQRQAIADIGKDLSSQKPMNRLLQGEVGSGKTVVAAFALWLASKNGYRSAFMAPTEILAKQHYRSLQTLFNKKLKLELSTSSAKVKDKEFDIVVGTQALLHQNFQDLGLVVVDEQQRFGVSQRQLLRGQSQKSHFLTMTATPIPRTLALTLYGQLKLSYLDSLPTKRRNIKTYLVPRVKRDAAYDFIRRQINAGGQAFIVCPLINTSESQQSLRNAKEEYESLKHSVFPEFKIGLLHGKLAQKDKDEVMTSFRQQRIQILVSTAVVEVGIDIPNATVVVVEAAERFGLSSLHQLRGRVGRAGQKGFCLLFTETTSTKSQERLKLLETHSNGLEVAELDLKLRGPGDLFGTAQSGQIELKTAAFVNLDLIERSKKAAQELVKVGLSSELENLVATVSGQEHFFSND